MHGVEHRSLWFGTGQSSDGEGEKKATSSPTIAVKPFMSYSLAIESGHTVNVHLPLDWNVSSVASPGHADQAIGPTLPRLHNGIGSINSSREPRFPLENV